MIFLKKLRVVSRRISMSFKAIPGGLAARAPQASPNPPGTGPEGCLAAGLMGAFFPFPPKQIPLCVVTNLRTCSRECALSVQRFVLSLKTKFHRKLKNSWKKISKQTHHVPTTRRKKIHNNKKLRSSSQKLRTWRAQRSPVAPSTPRRAGGGSVRAWTVATGAAFPRAGRRGREKAPAQVTLGWSGPASGARPLSPRDHPAARTPAGSQQSPEPQPRDRTPQSDQQIPTFSFHRPLRD